MFLLLLGSYKHLYSGLTLRSALREDFWQAYGILWVVGNWAWVSYLQGKHLLHCSITPAPPQHQHFKSFWPTVFWTQHLLLILSLGYTLYRLWGPYGVSEILSYHMQDKHLTHCYLFNPMLKFFELLPPIYKMFKI